MTVATDAGAVARTPAQVAQDTILVLDFGSQYSQLIARRVREAKVYCELVPGTISAEEIRRRDPRGLIFSGGPASVFEAGAPHPGPGGLRPRHPDPRHLLRDGPARREPRRRGRTGGAPRVRARIGDRGRGSGALREASRRARGLDVARRRRHRAAAGLPADRALAQLVVRRVRRPGQAVRHPVPSRGGAHAARARHPAQLPHRCLRLRGHLGRPPRSSR